MMHPSSFLKFNICEYDFGLDKGQKKEHSLYAGQFQIALFRLVSHEESYFRVASIILRMVVIRLSMCIVMNLFH
jgi:hypothetical protein